MTDQNRGQLDDGRLNDLVLSTLADELEASLWRDLIDPWFPACVDPEGGFFQDFSEEWVQGAPHGRFVVFQARMTWLAATLSELPGECSDEFRRFALHGMRFLRERFLDGEGGVLWQIDETGHRAGTHAREKHAYGTSFVIYAMAAVHRATGSPDALRYALRSFDWLERNLYDDAFGGYFECTDETGKRLVELPAGSAIKVDGIGTTYGLKSQNTHLHLLEALTELAQVCDDPRVTGRLAEIRSILVDKLFHPDGWLHICAEADWSPVPGLVSFGHDVEAAHLLLAADAMLSGGPAPETERVAQALLDYALRHGYDRQRGGFFNLSTPTGEVRDQTKVWWVQAEALLGFVRGLSLSGAPRSDYLEAVQGTWRWIQDRQIDRDYGGWHGAVAPDDHILYNGVKGDPWKAAYHDGRALLFSAQILRNMCSEATPAA